MRERGDLAWYYAWALVVIVVSAVAGWQLAAWTSHREARDDAGHQAERMARAIAAPNVYARPDAEEQDKGMRRLDRLVRERIAEGLVLRVKVWDADGTVIYSDEPRLVGRQFDLGPKALALLGEGGSLAELTQLDADENILDRRLGRGIDSVVEVYAGFTSADGVPLLFEAYVPVEDLLHHERETAVLLVPAMTAGPVVAGVLIFLLGLRMTRRVRAADQESIRAMHRVFSVASTERRRICRELHDSVLPELASARLLLEATERHEADPERRTVLATAVATLARQMDFLRQAIAGETVASPSRVGLETSLEAAADQARAGGLRVEVHATSHPLDDAAGRLAVAVAHEGLRNVRRHAEAKHARVSVDVTQGVLTVDVTDDGRGPSSTELHADHGLGLIADTVSDLGGASGLERLPGGGARAWVRVPLDRLSGEVVRTAPGR